MVPVDLVPVPSDGILSSSLTSQSGIHLDLCISQVLSQLQHPTCSILSQLLYGELLIIF